MAYCKKFFDLTIGPDYVPLWGIWEAVREFIQNGLDGAQDGYAFDIHRGSNGTVVIRNKGAVLLPKHLILGETSKAGGEYRGQYGEGFKLGMMALCRIAKSVGRDNALVIHTGDETWVPTIHKSEQYGTDIIRVNTYPRKADGFLTIEIPDVNLTEWLKIQDRILILGIQKKESVVHYGELLLEEKCKGFLFCKGLWVSGLPAPSKYGYNMMQVSLDRDRKMADNYSLKTSISGILSNLCLTDKVSCVDIFEMLGNEQSIEFDALRWYPTYDTVWLKFKEKIGAFWKEMYGEKAIPVSTPGEQAFGASLGQLCISVPPGVKTFLGEQVLQLSDVKAAKQHEVSKVYDIMVDLDQREQYIVEKVQSLARKAVTNRPWSLRIVDFAMPDLMGLCNFNEGLISVSRRPVCDYMSFMSTFIHELGHLPGYLDQTKEHMDEVTRIASRMLYLSNEDVT